MIAVEFDEHCPFCNEEVCASIEDGDDLDDYVCECGAHMKFEIQSKIKLTWSPK